MDTSSPQQPEQPQPPSDRPVQLAKPEQPPVPVTRVAEAELRASDADRERIAELLRDAYAEGRLTVEEHAERIEAAYGAKTLGELVPLTRDLPSHPVAAGEAVVAPAPRPAPVPLPPARNEPTDMVAVFGGATRKGRWRVGSVIRATAIFGGIEIDLTDAVFESPEVEITVNAFFGGVSVRVPENVTLVGTGFGIFGGFDVREQTAPDPHAPVVRVKGSAIFGGADAKARKGKKLKEWTRHQLRR
ncbi:DUF1707 domain-containing protein [Kitasatospora sp. NPDC006697]|uniref:DUF1707 SHOCT-like domain-containing protein n=1 Tax=Kitasatospora sp. NPDC006697 TaxID=3364020 RepID=UPI0036AC8944